MHRRRVLRTISASVVFLALALATPVVSVAQAKDGIGEIVAGLSARLEATRQRSLIELARVIEADPRVRDRADVHVAVADLLRAEKARILEWGRQRKADEEGEYDGPYSDVLSLAVTLLGNGRVAAESGLLAAMVDGVYNPGSDFAKTLAAEGEPALAPAIERSHAPRVLDRLTAYDLLGEMLRLQTANGLRHPLRPAAANRARLALRAGLLDTDAVGRMSAIDAIVNAGDREAIPLLRTVSVNDPDGARPEPSRPTVRQLAAEAVYRLEMRH